MGKGEIAHHEQFLLFPTSFFHKTCTADVCKQGKKLNVNLEIIILGWAVFPTRSLTHSFKRILAVSKLKGFADDKLNVTQNL